MRGEFENWSREKCISLTADIAETIRWGLTEAITGVISHDLYKAYRSPPIPKGMNLDSQYGLCFRGCLYRTLDRLSREKNAHKLFIVIEDGHPNVQNAVQIFNEVKADFDRDGAPILGSITVAKKHDSLPLMLADFQAHATSLSERLVRAGKADYFAQTPELPKSGEAGWSHFEFTPESISGWKTAWETDKQKRIEQWRAARNAKRASASSKGEQSA